MPLALMFIIGIVIGYKIGKFVYSSGPKGNDMNPENPWV